MAYGYSVSGSGLSSALGNCNKSLGDINVTGLSKIPDISSWSGTNINKKINDAIKKVESKKKSLSGKISGLQGIANTIQNYQDVRAKLEAKEGELSRQRSIKASYSGKKNKTKYSGYNSAVRKISLLTTEINELKQMEVKLKSSLTGAGYPPQG